MQRAASRGETKTYSRPVHLPTRRSRPIAHRGPCLETIRTLTPESQDPKYTEEPESTWESWEQKSQYRAKRDADYAAALRRWAEMNTSDLEGLVKRAEALLDSEGLLELEDHLIPGRAMHWELERDCHLCGALTDPLDLSGSVDSWYQRGETFPTIDHVVPRSMGGSDDPANLRRAHHICNARKGVKALEDLALPFPSPHVDNTRARRGWELFDALEEVRDALGDPCFSHWCVCPEDAELTAERKELWQRRSRIGHHANIYPEDWGCRPDQPGFAY